jgi:hypothetical protein
VAKDTQSAAATPATGAAAKSTKRKKEFRKKKEKRVVPHGVVCIQATFNNTIITLTDPDGRAVSWSSAGSVGFKGSRKGSYDGRRRGARSIRNEIGGSPREGSRRWSRVRSTRPGIVGPPHQRN